MGTIDRVLDEARKKLLDTGTRNRLVHVNRKNQRSNTLNIINELSDEIFRQLHDDGRRMRFKAMGRDKGEDEEDTLFALEDLSAEDVSEDRLTDSLLETPLGPKAMQKRLLRLATDARVAEQETGLNILYLAMGFLKWREDKASSIDREAPLILLPVELVRNERTSTYDIRYRGDEISTNLPLASRLRQDFGLILPEVPEREDWRPSDYFALVENIIDEQPDWGIDRDGMQLGFFSFAKLLMHRDLAAENWPDGELMDGNLIGGLLEDGFDESTSLFGPDDKLDALLDPADIIQVVDADASQTKVIEEVRHNNSLVVQGPPGTGKSQTITNLIAAAVHDGKTVLFVAEKMAALTVVYERLVKTGLRDICVELHSRSANKKALSQELGRTLAASMEATSAAHSADTLRASRDRLNGIAHALHEPLGPGRFSPFEAMSQIAWFIGQQEPPPRLPLSDLGTLTKSDRDSCSDALERFAEARKIVGVPEQHPFHGVSAANLQPLDLERAKPELDSANNAIASLVDGLAAKAAAFLERDIPDCLSEMSRMVNALRQVSDAPKGLSDTVAVLLPQLNEARFEEALQAGCDWAEMAQEESTQFTDAAWHIDSSTMRSAMLRGESSFFARLGGTYRRASTELSSVLNAPLPGKAAERRALVDRVAAVQKLRRALSDEEGYLKDRLGEHWRGERTDFSMLRMHFAWLRQSIAEIDLTSVEAWKAALSRDGHPLDLAAQLETGISAAEIAAKAVVDRFDLELDIFDAGPGLVEVPLDAFAEKSRTMSAGLQRYPEWSELVHQRRRAIEAGGTTVVEAVLSGELDPTRAVTEFRYACAEAAWNEARKMRRELDELAHVDRHELVTTFRALDKSRFDEMRDQVLSRHYAQMPKGSMGEMATIRGEIARKRGHKPIRWLMKNAGGMVQRIKPVFLMSPLSVAQFLPPGAVKFDLLVIDEASQIKPEDAFGVVARAKQIVVVGDQKQLPPTSFFDRLANSPDEEDEEDAPIAASAADMESILTLCEARGLRSRMLEWHYRSRDPSLIRVSNAEFYESNLVLPPSPLELDEDYGLQFTYVPGAYSSASKGHGRAGTNKIEAQAVVNAAAEHARKWPTLSLGIVTFSKRQADMITEILEHARRSDNVLDAFLREGQAEDVFVKNIENVQGDERDVILISVGYGPHEPNGRLASMNFGPVNGDGGERRLNVLFSRARVRCEVFASFQPGDIDTNRTTKEGPRVLKRFLEYAKSGQMEQPEVTGLGADSPFEEDVASVITRLGYSCDLQVGSAGFRIDMAVRNPDRPGQYLLAVECDGATYHSALWARERDRLRQDVLEGLGWTFHRIWSTDWFHRREQEIARLESALVSARERAAISVPIKGSNTERPVAEEKPDVTLPEIQLDALEIKVPLYERAELSVTTTLEPHEVKSQQMAQLVRRVVEVEGPVHLEEVARRVANAFGKQRVGNRILEAVREALQYSRKNGEPSLTIEDDFWMTNDQKADPAVRDRAAESGTLIKAKALPPVEILAAGRLVAAECGQLELDEQVKAVCRVFGYQRVGPDLRSKVEDVLRSVV
ncbi:DUF3320 domain-containing protein [Aliiroseovarius sp. S1123]|uniref:DUF3320 domain-containing protein n=1 Tax=Aliiroseovarius sp. S1123 TaxID=2926404 RepID=UPI001FF6C18C|nr:DUF3320 domain-containing protein [Aliiroseovarius sp. S1123]MCK0169579.1 DUF3320 domain-containing protein [Aliiroseovarius sp. S1123]